MLRVIGVPLGDDDALDGFGPPAPAQPLRVPASTATTNHERFAIELIVLPPSD
jgi:hypothetical protein